MEPLTSAWSSKRSWVPWVVLIAVLLAGPSFLPGLISAMSSLITLPINHQWTAQFGGYETFNTDILLVYVISVVGLNLIMQAGLLALGQSAVMAVGAYTVAIMGLHFHVPFGIIVLLATVLSGLVGLVLALPSLRLGLFTLALVTVGYSLVATALIQAFPAFTGGGNGIIDIAGPSAFPGSTGMYWLLSIVTIVSIVFAHNYLRSPFGRSANAVHENPIGARALGINAYFVKVRAFVIGSAFGGLAGALFAPTLGSVAPDSFTINLSILLLLMTILGGRGTLVGPLIGAIVLFRIPIAVQDVTSNPGDLSTLIYGIILLLSVYLAPQGIMSLWWRLRRRMSSHTDVEPRSVGQENTVKSALVELRPETEKLLDCIGVRKNLNGVQALDGVDISVRPGTIHALIGPNGSGKTTLLNVLSGYIRADAGRVSLDQQEITRRSVHERAHQGIGRTFQTPVIFEGMTAGENLMLALDQQRRGKWKSLIRLPTSRRAERGAATEAERIIDAVGLSGGAKTPAKGMAPGQRRLLEVGRVLAQRPSVVLMDEPASGLPPKDIDHLMAILRYMRDLGVAVLLVEHHVEIVLDLADEVTVLDFGKCIAHGSVAEIKDNEHVRSAYFGQSAVSSESK